MHRHQSSQRYVRLIMTFTAGLLILAMAAFAQENSGKILGTVTDASGAVVPSVSVTATSSTLPGMLATVTDGSLMIR